MFASLRILFSAVVLAEDAYLSTEDFPLLSDEFAKAGIESGPPPVSDGLPLADSMPQQGHESSASTNHDDAVAVFDREGHLRSLQEIEKDLIALAIDTYQGKMSEVARRLGMGRSTLYRKLREHDLEVRRAS